MDIIPTQSPTGYKQLSGRAIRSASLTISPCRCGGHGVLQLEVKRADVIIYWVECDTCHKWTEETRSEPSAVQNWNDRQGGIIARRKHHLVNAGF